MANFKRARTLVKSVRYPTYQLYATSRKGKASVDEQLRIAILITLEWLRTKFSEFEIPEEINLPSSNQYLDVSLSDFKSVHLDKGYSVDIVSIPQQKIWSLELVEPDMSTSLVDGIEVSTAIPGRLFQTEIAFSAYGSILQCGIRITISDPETVSESCNAYRPVLVKALIEEPLLALECGYPLQATAWSIKNTDQVKQIKDYLDNGNLPVVILCDYKEDDCSPTKQNMLLEPLPRLSLDIGKKPYDSLIGRLNVIENGHSLKPPIIQKNESKPIEAKKVSYDCSNLLQYRIAYAHYFQSSTAKLGEINKTLKINLHEGDIAIINPCRFGGGYKAFHKTSDPEDNIKQAFHYLLNYPKGKAFFFGKVVFHDEAKVKQLEELVDERGNTEDTIKSLQEEIELLKAENARIQAQQADEIRRLQGKLNSLQESLDQKIAEIKSDADSRVKRAEQERDRFQSKIAFHESLAQRPKKPNGIPEWVESQFEGRLILHKKAIKLISDTMPDEVDVPILCDAIEFLATEYYDMKTGLISEDEANTICAEKYGRPFEVTPIGNTTIEFAPSEYKIKYFNSQTGKAMELPLEWHLKWGNTPPRLVRIYFLYDKEKKLIVVGSLPKHLKTVSISS